MAYAIAYMPQMPHIQPPLKAVPSLMGLKDGLWVLCSLPCFDKG